MKKRVFGLDLVRTIAIIFVLLVHVLLNTEFVKTPMIGIKSFLFLGIRNLTLTCVPLFIILTGYCKSDKKVEKKHYQSLKKILIH